MKSLEIQKTLIEISKRNSIDSATIQQYSKEDFSVNITFLGEFSAGKTTIVNALLGRKNFLPAFSTPTNAVIVEISKGNEDLFQALKVNEEGNEEIYDIEFMDLANEITKSELNKKIIIKLKDVEFLKENLKIIDTPGINSINDMHTDVTYGYLPFVDIAFIVLNITINAPKTLLEFLKQFPEEQFKKIVFVLNFCDNLDDAEIIKLRDSINNEISNIIENPRIIHVSPLKALELKKEGKVEDYKNTGMYEIEKIINDEIPELKNRIQEDKFRNHLKTQAFTIKDLLNINLNSLTWDTEEFDNEIKKTNLEIENLNSDLSKFKKDFENIKESCIKNLNEIISENVEIIGHKISKDESYDDTLNLIIDDTNNTIKKALSRIEGLKVDSINQNFSEIVKSSINLSSQQIKAIADILTDAATFAATVWLVPAPPATKVATETTKATGSAIGREVIVATTGLGVNKGGKVLEKVSKSGKTLDFFGKGLAFLGKVIKEINPLEKIKTALLPYFLNPSLRKSLSNKFIKKIEFIFEDIEFEIKKIIEDNYLKPLKEKDELLTKLKKDRKDKTINIDKTKEIIENDIKSLDKII